MPLFSAIELARQAAALTLGIAMAITPPPDQHISQWAEGRVIIPGETGTTREGPLSWEGFEPLIEPLDRLHPDDPCRTVTFCGSAQIAKTTIGVLATLYYSTALARPWGVALPTGDEALKYNRTKWQPIVDATPELRRKIRPVTSRDEQGSTNTYKRFAGGYGQFFGTTTAKPLQMVTFCLVVKEETPNWTVSVGDRGDPHAQIARRQLQWELAGAKTFHNATPGLLRRNEDEDLGGCPITADFKAGDQRRLYLPCPWCADSADGALVRLDREAMLGLGQGETPHFACPSCGGVIEHRHKAAMVAACHPYKAHAVRGGWLPTFASADPGNPSPGSWVRAADYEFWRARDVEGRQPSYHAWQIVSAAVDWAFIAREIRDAEAGDEPAMIALYQQIFGEAYELTVQKADVEKLMERRDDRLVRGVVPSGYEIVTCAVDLNGDWAQWTAYGWGPGGEHVVVDKGRFEGGPSEASIWIEMAALERTTWPHEDGGRLGVEVLGVDSGYGTWHVYAFCSSHGKSKALDGADKWGAMPLRRGPRQKLQGPDGTVVSCRTWRVGTWDLKRELLNAAIPLSLEGDKGAKAVGRPHWPGWVQRDFFEELTGEALVTVHDGRTGVVKDEAWVRVRRRNEEMDLWVYNRALAASLGVGVPGAEPDWLDLERRRLGQDAGLEALWDRPTAQPGRQAEVSAEASADDAGGKSRWSFS